MKGVTLLTVLGRLRPWLALAAAVLVLGVLLPPAGTYARQYAVVQALQFVIFAVAGPALLVIGAGASGLFSWFLAASDATAIRYAILRLLVFMAAVIIWRLPAVTGALERNPLLAVLEMGTMLTPGLALWAELAGRPSGRYQASRPLRAALAALAMWTIWIIAYVTGMSSHGTGSGLSSVTDQQAGVAIMWAVPAICFVPVVYALLISWLGEREDPDRELREADGSGSLVAGLASAPRPPRGWRLPRS
jgi:cytochrome c oxidase assembly factor CtaG